MATTSIVLDSKQCFENKCVELCFHVVMKSSENCEKATMSYKIVVTFKLVCLEQNLSFILILIRFEDFEESMYILGTEKNDYSYPLFCLCG